jgi:hypothetical protein
MPQHKQRPNPSQSVSPGDALPTASRRQVLVGTAAGLAVVAAAPVIAQGAGVVASAGAGDQPRPDEGDQLVAHVRDLRSGDIDVFVGERQVRIRDRAVAARLAAAGSGT